MRKPLHQRSKFIQKLRKKQKRGRTLETTLENASQVEEAEMQKKEQHLKPRPFKMNINQLSFQVLIKERNHLKPRYRKMNLLSKAQPFQVMTDKEMELNRILVDALFLLGANKQMVLALTSVIAVEHLQQSMVDWLAEVHEQGGTWTLHGFTQKLNQLRTPPAPATEM